MSDFILDFWSSQARKHGTDPSASWGDSFAISLELENIGQHIKSGLDVLDVGCANGFAVVHHLAANPKSFVGIDFSEAMIEQAKKRSESLGSPSNVAFEVGDVRKLPFSDAAFDVVYTTRTLINLPNWSDQVRGVEECLRVCRPGGTVIFSEAFWEPLVKLNSLRTLFGLSPLVEHDFNRYLKKTALDRLLEAKSLEYKNVDFSSVYYFGSRFLRELVTKIEDYPGYSNPINEIFYKLEREYSGGGVGIQQAYIVRV